MAETFFIPTDPEGFFADNPQLAAGRRAPPQPALRFGPGCLGCGAPTEALVELVGGFYERGRPVSWSQSVRLCEGCQRARAAHARRHRVAGRAAALLALASALALSAVARRAGLEDALWLLLLAPTALALWLPLWIAARALAGGHELASLDHFRDPRKGPRATILCLHIGHDGAAADFADRNPHAIRASDWEESYARITG
jgi:hypothetical protein